MGTVTQGDGGLRPLTKPYRIVLLWLAMLAPPVFAVQPAQSDVCNSDGKTANLDFVLKDMNGKDVRLSAYEGKVILLDFWATWAPSL
ncbi:MAG: redoxin domain-containing protein [Acidobacteria bacterium]|nr:redoxin domain-containing protein [Acidobacteriota bacterium]